MKKDNAITRFFKTEIPKQKVDEDLNTLKRKRKVLLFWWNTNYWKYNKLEVLEKKLGIRLLQLVQGNWNYLIKSKRLEKQLLVN